MICMQLTPKMTAVVIGLGTAGLATVRDLLRLGVRVKVTDQRQESDLDRTTLAYLAKNHVEMEFGGHTAAFIDGADVVIPGPGVPLQAPILAAARSGNIAVSGELAVAAGRFPVPVIGVTGSNGKTTVTSLIGALLKASGKRPFVGGNIGNPLLEFFSAPENYDCAVLELSSFQLDLAGNFRPDIGLLLNVTPDHLDRHGSMETYTEAKRKLFACQVKGDVAILGEDDALAVATIVRTDVRRLLFGHGDECAARIDGSAIVLQGVGQDGATTRYDLSETHLASPVNRLNAAAAILAVTMAGCGEAGIKQGLAAYQPPAHRMAEVGTVAGVRFIDDSKATNIGAMAAAVAGCAAPVVLIAGGKDKGGDYHLVTEVIRQHVKNLLLIGEATPLMEAVFSEVVPCERADSLEAAVRRGFELAEPGDVVLLAPGCSSFDMFTGYVERGNVFSRSVQQLRSAQG